MENPNLKKINNFIIAPHFKLEDWKIVIGIVSGNRFMATVDLEDEYFVIPIDSFKTFLRFKFENDSYEFNCLPFELYIAPYIDIYLQKL